MKRHASLNRIFRIVWSQVNNAWIVVAETVKGRGKSASRRKSIALTLTLVGSLLGAPPGHASPSNGQVSAGAGTIVQTGALTNIHQSSANLALNWQGFSIAANETVNFLQPSATAIALNRVVGQDPSQIFGNLFANGQVFILNPNGVLFGATAQIDVGGLITSSLSMSDADLMRGSNFFTRNGAAGAVVNQGTLRAANGGYIALLAPEVRNEGVITARLGTALLAAGNKVTINLDNGSLLSYAIDQGALHALAENRQLIQADGGRVIMSARAADALSVSAVNNTGVIEARSIENQGGTIKLMGDMEVGQVNVGGTLDASAPDGGNGGFIETSAAHVKVAESAYITTAAPHGKSGNWLIDPTDYVIGFDISGATLGANLAGGNVTIQTLATGTGNGDILVTQPVNWLSANTLTLNAYRNITIYAPLVNSAGGNLVLRSDMTGTGIGTINPYGGYVYLTGGGRADMYYNPLGYVAPANFTSFAQGGTPYTAWMLVNDAQHMQAMASNPAGAYALGKNIDASATSTWNPNWPLYNGFVPVGSSTSPFTGQFDGLNHTISNLTINRSSQDYVGLFGNAGSASVVRNVGLMGGSTAGHYYVGSLVGYGAGTVSNAYATGSVNGTSGVGGLVGYNTGTISNVYATGAVSGSYDAGGLVGYNSGIVTNAYATGSVSGGMDVGGLVGFNYRTGSISNAYATGSVSGSSNVGGVVGLNDSYTTSTYVPTQNWVTSGYSYSCGWFSSCWQDTSHWVYGGYYVYTNYSGTVNNVYWDTQTSGTPTGVGGSVYSGNGATALTTAQMMQAANMPGLNFSNTWWLSSGNTRPFLQSEYNVTINNAHQLQLMAMNQGANYTLSADIDMAELASPSGMWGTASGSVATGITTGFVPVDNGTTAFTGQFDGQGHTISNLTINRPAQSNVGLFGVTAGSSAVRNVGLVGGRIVGANAVGALVGYNTGTISDAYSTAIVSGISGSGVGGLVGRNTGMVSNAYATGDVIGGSTSIDIGGLIGWHNGNISNAYATGNVTGGGGGGSYYIGGLVGLSYGVINNAYATGNVSGIYYIGGLLGTNYGSLNNSYAAGSVSGCCGAVGKLVGDNYAGNITGSYWDTQTPGPSAGVGASNPAGAIGLPTVQMKTMSSFTGWNIANNGGTNAVWRIYEGSTYPLLRNFLTPLTVTANAASKSYDGLAYSGGNGVTYSVSSALLSGLLSYSGTSQGAINAGSYQIAPSGAYSNQQGYDINFVNGALTVAPAPLSVTANAASKSYDGLAYSGGNGVAYSGFVNSESASALGGALTYGGTAQGATSAGSYTITPGGLTSGNYTLSFNNGALTVAPAPLSVTANAASKSYDGLAYSGGNGVAYSGFVNSESASALGGALTYGGTAQGATSAGSYTITPGGLTSGNYTLSFNNGALTVAPAPLSVTANAASKSYDGLAYSGGNGVAYSGFVNSESASALGGALTYGGTAQGATSAGSYTITPGGLTSGNYTLSFNNGALTVAPAPLSVTANAASKSYDGLAYSGGNGVAYSGFVNSESASALGGALTYGGTAQGATSAGSYTITPGGLTSGNYTLSFNNGALTVAPAPLSVTANAASKSYDGLAYSGGNGVAYSGFVNSESASALGGALTYGGTAQGATSAGSYTITPGGLTSGNYTLSFNNGALTVAPAPLSVTANAASKSYDGLAYSGGNGVAYSGFVNSESASALGGALTYGGTAQGATSAGSYTITPGGLTSGNYTLSFNNGALTITANVPVHAVNTLGGSSLASTYQAVTIPIFSTPIALETNDLAGATFKILNGGVRLPEGLSGL